MRAEGTTNVRVDRGMDSCGSAGFSARVFEFGVRVRGLTRDTARSMRRTFAVARDYCKSRTVE